MFIDLTDENFEEEILKADKPLLVDFWLPGCGPCFLLAPILEKLAQEFEGKIIFAKVNLDNAPLTARKYGVNAAPTIVLFMDGKPASGFLGLKPEEAIRTWLEENLLLQEYRAYAEKNGFSLNPDRRITETIIRSLLARKKEFGERYCPCRKISGDKEEDKKIICPCVYHFEEIEKQGKCLCGLFVKKIVE